MMKKKPLLVALLLNFFSTVLVWLPFFINKKMSLVFANYDGPNYLVVAKCWYHPQCIRTQFSLPLPLEYYPAHFPGYPFLIALLDNILPGWWAMLIATLLGNLLFTIAFWLLLKGLKIKNPLWLLILSLFLPARILILRSVGAPETLFIAALLFSLIFFQKNRFFLAGVFLALAQLIKTPAILLFLAYGVVILKKEFLQKHFLKKKPSLVKIIRKYWGIGLGPLVILPIFLFFRFQTGDFWAYFHSGDNFHLVFPPYQAFISSRSWLGDFWLEDIVYIYLLGGIATAILFKNHPWKIISVFPAIFWLATLFVSHRDISRYSAPLYPFWLIAYAPFLEKKEFKIVFFILLPAIFLYGVNFITYNVAPIADWAPYY